MKASKASRIYPLIIATIIFLFCKPEHAYSQSNSGTVKDIDGNVYNTVTIGKQVWMVENLRVTKYRNGEPIPGVTTSTEWSKLQKGAYCNYENKSANALVYGRLYNWFAVNDKRGITPKGWRIPTNDDWEALVKFLGGEAVAGGKMKDTGLKYWLKPNAGATNSSGFKALPGGIRGFSGGFSTMKYSAVFWSSTEIDQYKSYSRMLYYIVPTAVKNESGKQSGFSVRCIKE